MSFVPLPRVARSHAAPFLGSHEGAVDETLREVESAALLEVLGQHFEHVFSRAVAHLALEAPVTGLVRRIPLRQVDPLGASAQNPIR